MKFPRGVDEYICGECRSAVSSRVHALCYPNVDSIFSIMFLRVDVLCNQVFAKLVMGGV
jgi:hypothetical protein